MGLASIGEGQTNIRIKSLSKGGKSMIQVGNQIVRLDIGSINKTQSTNRWHAKKMIQNKIERERERYQGIRGTQQSHYISHFFEFLFKYAFVLNKTNPPFTHSDAQATSNKYFCKLRQLANARHANRRSQD